MVKVLWRVFQLRRAYRQATQQMNDVFNRRRESAGARRTARKKKKIGDDVGEYVAFEEIKTTEKTTVATDGGKTHIHTENQVEDAVWEDIK